MADEQEAIADGIEQETPAIEAEVVNEAATDEPQQIPDTDEQTDEATGEAEAVDETEYTEIEWEDGKKYTIPKALEGGILRNKDYTQKRQADAEKAKALESREAEINQRLQATEEELDARASIRAMDTQLAEYAKLSQADWDYHASVDPLATEKAWRNYQLLEKQRGEAAKTLETAQSHRTEKAQQDLAKRVQETNEYAAKNIPGWKPELTDTLVKFAQSEGIPEEAIKANWSPTFYGLLHKAHIGTLAMQRQSAVPKPPAVPLKPLATVGGKSSPTARTDLASADMDAYVAARKAGVGGKALK